jgi:hypothetical protein
VVGIVITIPEFQPADDVVWGRALAALDARLDEQTLSPKVYINRSNRLRDAWTESISQFPSAKSGVCCEDPCLTTSTYTAVPSTH